MRFATRAGILAAALGAVCLVPAAQAVPTNLSTGINVSGGIDQIWTVSYGNVVGQSTKVGAVTPGSIANGAWLANSVNSAWIMPNDPQFTDNNAPPAAGQDPLTLTYSTSFTLSASDVNYASLVGMVTSTALWTADNNAVSILLNGVQLGVSGPNPNSAQPYAKLWAIDPTTSGFQAGLNTLEITVINQPQNSGNPTGMRFEGQVVVPEPSTLAIAGLGAMGFGARAWRKRARRTARV